MPQQIIEAIRNFIESLVTDENFAAQYAADPAGKAAVEGITEADLSGVDMQQLVGQVCGELDLPDDVRGVLQSYASGNPPPAAGLTLPPPTHAVGQQSVEQVMQHLNYVTYVTHENNPEITTNIVDNSIDNSTHVDVDGEVHGDISVDPTNVNATGDGAVANAGDGPVTAATGDGANAVGGDNNGQVNSGDGAVVGTVDGPVNTGSNTGVIADGPVTDTVVGNDNQTANVDGPLDGSPINFGDGATVTNVNDATVTDSAVSGGGDATSVSDNVVDNGSAIGTGSGNVVTHNEDNDVNEYPEPPRMLEEEPAFAPQPVGEANHARADVAEPADAM